MSQKKSFLKKIFALFLSVILSLSSLFILPVAAQTNKFTAEETTVPDGFVAIFTPKDLKNISLDLSGSYILMNDIDLSGTSLSPIGGSSASFTGILDGNGHCIKNFMSSKGGLFGYIKGSTIKNLGMVDATVYCLSDNFDFNQFGYCAGSIANNADNSTISNCYNTGNILGLSTEDEYTLPTVVGGIVGRVTNNSSISMCYNTGNTWVGVGFRDSVAVTGGIVGEIYDSKISDCYNVGKVLAAGNEVSKLDVGGIVGAANYTDGFSVPGIFNCYNAGYVRVANLADMKDIIPDNIPLTPVASPLPNFYNRMGFGGIIGYLPSQNINLLENCYYQPNAYFEEFMVSDIGNHTQSSGEYAKPLTNEQMRLQESFAGFDFENVWKMEDDGYPILKIDIKSESPIVVQWWEKLPLFWQLVLKYLCFGWIWMK